MEVEAASVPVDDTQPRCALSGEKFEKFWHDECQVCKPCCNCVSCLNCDSPINLLTAYRSGATGMLCELVLMMLPGMVCIKAL